MREVAEQCPAPSSSRRCCPLPLHVAPRCPHLPTLPYLLRPLAQVDPVILATGHTYDRQSIERWLAQGHKTCPVTGMRLRHMELTPNFALRSAIMDWAKDNGVRLPERQAQQQALPVFKWDEDRAGNILHVRGRAEIAGRCHFLRQRFPAMPALRSAWHRSCVLHSMRLVAGLQARHSYTTAYTAAGSCPALVHWLPHTAVRFTPACPQRCLMA